MSKFWVLFKQVYRKNIKSGSFIFMVLSPIIIAAVVVVVGYFMMQGQTTPKIAILSNDVRYRTALIGTKSTDYKVNQSIKTRSAAEKALEKEKIDGYLTIDASADSVSAKYVQRDNSEELSETAFKTVLNNVKMTTSAQALKLSNQQLTNLLTPAKVTTKTISFENGKQVAKSNSEQDKNVTVAMAITIVMFVFITTYAGMIAQEIAAEKGSRVMEIVLSSVSATSQFFGKIFAMLALVITQILFYIVVALIALGIFKDNPMVKILVDQIDLTSVMSTTLWISLIFFIVGVLLYSVLSALLGSLVSRVEQVNQAIMPLTFFSLASYMGGFVAAQSPNSPIIEIGSYIPFFGQIIMPVRYAVGSVSMTNVIISIIISVVFLVVLVYFTVIIYKSNVLVYSDAGVMQALKKSMSILFNQKKKQVE